MGLKEDLIELFKVSFNHWECLEVAKGAKPIKDTADPKYDSQIKALGQLKDLAGAIYAAESKKKPRDDAKCKKVLAIQAKVNNIKPEKDSIDKSLKSALALIEQMKKVE